MKLKELFDRIVIPIRPRTYEIYLDIIDIERCHNIRLPNEVSYQLSEDEIIKEEYIYLPKRIVVEYGNFIVQEIRFNHGFVNIQIMNPNKIVH